MTNSHEGRGGLGPAFHNTGTNHPTEKEEHLIHAERKQKQTFNDLKWKIVS